MALELRLRTEMHFPPGFLLDIVIYIGVVVSTTVATDDQFGHFDRIVSGTVAWSLLGHLDEHVLEDPIGVDVDVAERVQLRRARARGRRIRHDTNKNSQVLIQSTTGKSFGEYKVAIISLDEHMKFSAAMRKGVKRSFELAEGMKPIKYYLTRFRPFSRGNSKLHNTFFMWRDERETCLAF